MKNEVRLNRLLIYGILGILYGAYLIYDYFKQDNYIWVLVIAICLILSSIVFLISSLILKNKNKKKNNNA